MHRRRGEEGMHQQPPIPTYGTNDNDGTGGGGGTGSGLSYRPTMKETPRRRITVTSSLNDIVTDHAAEDRGGWCGER
jgi:hypothetical protein